LLDPLPNRIPAGAVARRWRADVFAAALVHAVSHRIARPHHSAAAGGGTARNGGAYAVAGGFTSRVAPCAPMLPGGPLVFSSLRSGRTHQLSALPSGYTLVHNIAVTQAGCSRNGQEAQENKPDALG
jgi:hypothetical protein